MKVDQVQRKVAEEGLDAFLFSSQANVFYLSGFRSTHAYAVITPEKRYLLTDGRYYEKAKSQLKGWEVVLIKGRVFRFIKRFFRDIGAVKVGYERDRVTCDFRRSLRSTKIRWVGYSNFLRDLRVIKTKEEMERMREGVRRTDRIFRELLEFVRPGMRELDVRRFIVDRIFKEGSTGESFPAIVASGEGSAIPHWETSHRKIRNGEPLLIDMGLVWEGYCTDFTRTLFIGRPDPDFVKVYTVVRDAHLLAIEKVKVGNRIGDVDRAAREYISRKKLGRFFTHSTGHGIGVEIHEYPRVYFRGEDADRVIEEGMVFTVEPGVYIPGRFGVRLENIVVVVNGRGEPLSSVSLELVTL